LAKVVLREYGLEKAIGSDRATRADYYLGAVAPDVRYFSTISRERTHPDVASVDPWLERCESVAFACGYLVHLLVDQAQATVVTPIAVKKRFPFLPGRLRDRVTPVTAAALVEFYYLATFLPDFEVSGSGNSLTAHVGMDDADLKVIKQHIDEFLRDTSLPSIRNLLSQMGLLANPRIQRYLDLAFVLDRRPLIKRFMIWRLRPLISELQLYVVEQIRGTGALQRLKAALGGVL
jgi:hypothetical protein